MSAAPTHEDSAASRRHWRAVILLVVATIAIYGNSLRGPFVYDDIPAISANPTIRHFWPLHDVLLPAGPGGVTVSGRPVLNLSFALNYAISGESVWSYHLFNVLVHAAAGLVLFGLVRRTLLQPVLRGRFGPAATGLAFAIAALWVLHPLQTQAVTYTVQRAESLMGLFYLLTLYAFVRAAGSPSSQSWFWLCVAACALGMATKEVMATAPLLVLLYDRTFVDGSFREAWRQRRGLHLGLAATWLLLGALVLSTGGNRGGSIGIGVGVPGWAYALTQFEALTRYLALSVWPHPLVFEYGTFWVRHLSEVLPDAAFVLALLAGTLFALWRWPGPGFAGAWFFCILAPTSLSPGTTQMIVEHRMYLPLAAVLAILVLALYTWWPRRAWFACSGAALLFALLSVARNHDYRSAIALWSDTLAKRPDNPRAHENLAETLFKAGQLNEAIAHYEHAVRLAPDDSQFHYNLALALARTGQPRDAIAHYESALRLARDDANVHNNLALALAATGDIAGAEAHAAVATHLRPANAELRYNHALHLLRLGRIPEAIAEYEAALRVRSDYAEAHTNLGNVLLQLDRLPEAIAHYEQALRLQPDSLEAHNNLGFALLKLGRLPEAAAHYERVLKLAPDDATAHSNLGNIALQSGHARDAIAHFEAALRAKPDSVDALTKLGRALAQSGRAREAVAVYEHALRLAPEAAGTRYNLANALFQLEELAAAAAAYAEVVRLQPAFIDARFNLAATLLRLGRIPDAIASYEEILRRAPNDAGAHAELANILAQLNRTDEAISHFETALRLQPDFPVAREQLARLRAPSNRAVR